MGRFCGLELAATVPCAGCAATHSHGLGSGAFQTACISVTHSHTTMLARDSAGRAAARGAGFWEGVPSAVFAGAGDDKVKQILALVLAAHQARNVALWDLEFTKRFGQSVKDCVLVHCRSASYKYLSEHIRGDLPCKLFFDVEFYAAHNPGRHVRDDVRKMAWRLVEICCEELRMVAPDESFGPVVLYSSLPIKGSVHVILQAVFKNVAHVRTFVQELVIPRINANEADKQLFTVMDKQGPRLAIDTVVYKANGLLRCYGGMKVGVINPLLPWEGQTKLDQRLFLQSLLTVVAVAPEDIAMVQGDDVLKDVHVASHIWTCALPSSLQGVCKRQRIAGAAREATPMEATAREETPPPAESQTRTYPVAERDFARFLATYPPLAEQEPRFLRVQPVKVHEGTRWGQALVQNLNNPHAISCANRGSPHRSNSVYFHLNLESGHGYFTCSDADCAKKSKWGSTSYAKYVWEKR
jgi:hypothetical protein